MNEKINDILREYQIEPCGKVELQEKFNSKIWFEIADKILKSIKLEDLIIKPIDDSVTKLKFYRQKHLIDFSESERIYLNSKYTEKVCQNIKSLTFSSFYPILLIKLIDNHIITLDNEKYYIVFKYLYTNKSQFKNTNNYFIVKIFINYFYGILSSDKITKLNSKNFENFDIYQFIIYDEIKNKLKNDLIYLDTDTFYYFGDYDWSFDIPYKIENVDQLLIFRKKKYFEVINGTPHYHGFSIV